ncbi:MAG: hypothetical protein MJ188_11805 [Treponema sp.]|nr:hypothetical protein [Treponema sp.]
MSKHRKSYFADENEFNFFGSGTLSKLLIGFDCLFEGNWKQNETILAAGAVEVFKAFEQMGYELFLIDVPVKNEILEWLDSTFNYAFTCNDYPTRYADLCDSWTSISRNSENRLCSEGDLTADRNINFDGDWNKVLSIIKENDIVAHTESASIIYDDIDWNQSKEKNGLADSDGNNILGGSYIPVEKMNEKTTEYLKTIAIPRTDHPKPYFIKPPEERWSAETIDWDVKEDIAQKYGVKIKIEQGSLYYRGTWIKVQVKAPFIGLEVLEKICREFCNDYGFDSRKEIDFFLPYNLPWPEGQKKREEEDDMTEFWFDSLD